MTSGFGRATKTSVFMAVFVAVLMLGLPSFGNHNGATTGAVDQASAAAGDRTVYIGWVGMRDSVATLNPLLYTMAGEMSVIWPCYSFLTQYDIDGQTRIGDLAKSWSVAPDGVTWHFYLYNSATFYNMSNPAVKHPVTADDVIFTYYLVQNQTGNYLQSYFPKIDVGGVLKPMIDSMWKINDYEFYLKTVVPYAPFLSATGSIPILPQHIWEDRIVHSTKYGKYGGWNWPNYDPNLNVPPIVGSGAYYFMETGLTSTGDYRLGRSPDWFATQEYGWTLRNNVLYYKSETSTTSNYNDYKAGVVDIMIGVTPAQYLSTSDPLTAYGNRYAQSTGFVYELNINQITPTIRDTYGIAPQLGGKDNPILVDPVFKLAMAMSVDKDGFVTDALRGLGRTADSLMPDASPWHYWYGLQAGEDPLRPGRAPAGEEPVAYDPEGARLMLYANGWKYRTTGSEILSSDPDYLTYKPLCKAGGTQPLQFRFWTLNTAAEWDAGARFISNTTAIAGIDLITLYDVKSVGQMNSAWAQANYDLWLWDWMFSPVSEPSTDVMQVLTTEAIGSWSDIYWSDPAFDAVYYQSLQAVDPGARQTLVDQLQRMAYENMGCQLVAYRKELYAAGPAAARSDSDHWSNYGNWETSWLLMPDQLAPYLYMRIQPNNQLAPQITSIPESMTVEKGQLVSITASATDTDGTDFRWFWGDGGKDPSYVYQTTGSSTGTHTYTSDGYYTAWLAVKEHNGLDQFVNVTKIKITVKDSSNYAPVFTVDPYYTPGGPDQGTIVTLSATASDNSTPADTLNYWWVTNDGHTLFGQTVEHQFTDLAKTQATCYVDDGHVGTGSRPVSKSVLVNVARNDPPTITVPPVNNVAVGLPYQYNVSADDSNPGDKSHWRFTWDWGDGSALTVTSSPTASHTYTFKKIFSYTVWVDDMTGLSGHNVSGTNQIKVVSAGGNTAPVIKSGSFTVSPLSVVQGGILTFSGDVNDANKDMVYVDFEIYDSSMNLYDMASTTSTTKGGGAWTSVTVTYPTSLEMPVDTYTVYMAVSDGEAAPVYADTSHDVSVTQANRAPLVPLQPSLDLTVGVAHTFVSGASDPDGDTLQYWWDFGDGSYSSLATPSHAYAAMQPSSAYTVSVYDGTGNPTHNVTRTGYATANMPPMIYTGLSESTVTAGVDTPFSIDAWDDDDNLTLNFIWNWGDGSEWDTTVGINTASHTYAYPVGQQMANYTVTVYVNDLYMDTDGNSHNSSTSAIVHVVWPVDFTLTLTKGWNFVTVPGIGYGYTARLLGLAKFDTVASWNPATQSYDKTYIVGVSPIGQDFPILGSCGYWINTGANEVIHLYGQIPTGPQTRTVTIPGATGWINLAFNSLSTTLKASNIPGMFSGASVTSVAWYNSVTKTYKTYIPGVPPSDFTLIPGQAYWVSVNGGGTFTYTP